MAGAIIATSLPSDIHQAVYALPDLAPVLLRTTRASTHAYAPHFHDALSLGVIIDGQTCLSIPGQDILLGCGDMVLLPPMEVHSCNPLPGGSRSYHMFYLDQDWAKSLLDASECEYLVCKNRVIRDKRSYDAITAITHSIEQGVPDPDCLEILAGIVRTNCLAVPETPSSAAAQAQTLAVSACSPEQPATLAETARSAGIGREWLIRSFHRQTGITPSRYRQCLRLAKAMHMLQSGDDIAQTAVACGFSDQSHLHRMCVKYLSATPKQLQPGKNCKNYDRS